MRPVDALLDEYGESHQNKTNKVIHWICVPLIFFSTVGLFWSIPLGPLAGLIPPPEGDYLNWASLALALSLIWYFRLSVPLGVGMIAVSVGMLAACEVVADAVPLALWQTSLIIFVLAWVGQFIGHKIEGKKPSFLKDLQFLLVGPMWLMHFIYRKVGFAY
jgi:uncharacterized membrane protein YGL010W